MQIIQAPTVGLISRTTVPRKIQQLRASVRTETWTGFYCKKDAQAGKLTRRPRVKAILMLKESRRTLVRPMSLQKGLRITY